MQNVFNLLPILMSSSASLQVCLTAPMAVIMCRASCTQQSAWSAQRESLPSLCSCLTWPGERQPRHAVVAVPEQLDPQAARVGRQSVEPRKQVIEDLDQLPRVTASRES